MSEVHFLTFGSPGWAGAVERIKAEALASGAVDWVWALDASELDGWGGDPHARGFGFWSWKPWLSLRCMREDMKDGDVLVYSDAGNTITKSGEWTNLISLAKLHDFVGFFTDYPEQRYTKADLFFDLPLRNKPDPLAPQLWAGAWLMKRCTPMLDLLAQWEAAFADPHLVDDSPSVAPNGGYFHEHRHDQSVLSLLVKDRCDPRGFLSHSLNFQKGYPIQCTRKR